MNNRIIKFRVWHKLEREMYEVNEIHFDDFGFIVRVGWFSKKLGRPLFCQTEHEVKREVELMQFTGLKDKNGKEIYEMDVIKVDWGIAEPYLVENKYDKPFVVEWRFYAYPPFDRYLPMPKNIEVIGNIYESPELLKESRK